MQRVLAVLEAGAERVEPLVRRYLPRVVAGLLVVATAAANVPAADAGRRTARLAGAVTAASTFLGDPAPGRAGAEASARALTTSLGGLPVEPDLGLGPWVRRGGALVAADRCPPTDLVVSWRPPSGGHRVGAYVEPLGPPPTSRTTEVNGLVRCRTSAFAILGFEAAYEGGRWRLAAVPSLADETGEPLLAGEAEATGATPAASAADGVAGGGPGLPGPVAWAGAPLEALAPYVPQTTCDPVAKPGVLGFRDLLLANFPATRNLGIGRACEAEGVSEHKEGRAFDWGVDADDPAERAAADEVLAWLLGPDPETGEPFAIARRLGVMYVIWDGQIWSSFRAVDGWRPYVGVSGHRDHIHVSFDWSGALAETSFWRGGRAAVRAGSDRPDLPLVPVAPTPTTIPGLVGVPPGAILPPVPLPPGLTVAPPDGGGGGGGGGTAEGGADDTPTTTTTTTTTTAPPPTTTTAPPPTTTTSTTAPPPALVPAPPTTIRLGGL